MVQSQDLQELTIGKLAAAGGVGVETIRFYQRKGLLATPKRLEGVRRYGGEDVRRLRFIKQAQAAGFTLEEIGSFWHWMPGTTARLHGNWRRRSLSSWMPGLESLIAPGKHSVSWSLNAQRTRPDRVPSWLPLEFELGSGRPRRESGLAYRSLPWPL